MQVAGQYYDKRLCRMVPRYYSILAFVYAAFLPLLSISNSRAPEARRAIGTLWFNTEDGCPDRLWTNLLFANNQVTRAGCMKYAWSQAVQVGTETMQACCGVDQLRKFKCVSNLNCALYNKPGEQHFMQ